MEFLTLRSDIYSTEVSQGAGQPKVVFIVNAEKEAPLEDNLSDPI